ncbi:MAG: DegQ family serine endoprotease [candidate division KSB1 bacterium]|nr:DegQ family serine endoprotease [candidate division KSB1 bacterium]
MSKKYLIRSSGIMLLMVGIIVGLGLALGFNWTPHTMATPVSNAATMSEAASGSVTQTDITAAQQLSNVFASVSEQVNPSVVTIFTETNIKAPKQMFDQSPFEQFFGDDFFKRFFEMPAPRGDFKKQGLGSGVIVNANGTILTNNHVVDNADQIKVRLIDGREFTAKVKGTDSQTDIAVITVDAKNLTPIKIGNSDNIRVGDWVLAIGSPLNPQLEHTVTAGIVSAKGRSGVGLSQYEDYIQTDAAINPGNSGGALVNLNGELIGINTAIATQTGGFMGIGFAIPVNLAKKIMGDIVETGKVTRGWLGVYIQNITPDLAKAMKLDVAKGVIVSKVEENSPADKAGIKEEDVILKLNGKDIDNTVELSTLVASTSPKSEIDLKILRNGKPMDVKVRLGELTANVQRKAESGRTSYENIGLAVSNITPALIQKYDLPTKITGVVVTQVDPNGAAAQFGIQEGDVIMKVNRENIRSVADFEKQISSTKPGENILFYLRRGDGNLFLAFPMPEK